MESPCGGPSKPAAESPCGGPSKPTAAAGLKLTVERDALLKALAHAAAVVERRNTIPILSNVLLDASDGGLRLTATDLSLTIGMAVPARVSEAGATTVSAHLLNDIVRELAAGAQVELAGEDGRLAVASGRSRYRLQILPRDDFPLAVKDFEGVGFALPAKDLAAALGKVAFAQCDEPTRFYMCGVAVEKRGAALTLAATNGHCLATAELGLDAPGEGDFDAILPTKFVAELRKLLGDSEDEVAMTVGAGKASASLGGIDLSGKLVEGSFPDWRRALPSANDKKLLITPATFAGAVRRARVVASEKTRSVRLDLTKDKLTVSVSSPENGTATEESPAAYEAEDLTVGFNSKYLLDTFAAIGGDELQVELGDAAAPALFTNPADSTARWVVMPMRV